MENSLHIMALELQEEKIIAKTMERIAEINALVDKENLPIGFEADEEGVWYLKEKQSKPPTRNWICSPLWVTTQTRDHKNENHRRILEFHDIDGYKHHWTMPAELLAGEGMKILGTLLNLGLRISPYKQAREKLLEYIAHSSPIRKARCVMQCGWYNDVFVLPSITIGHVHGEKIILQSPSAIELKNEISGSLDGWKEQVAKKASGNSRLILAISASLTGPLLRLLNHENIGVQYKGNSSLGKSTALHVANSTWGNPANVNTFRATANGLEGLAALHNDRLLCIDELGQISLMEAGQIVYMLGNGVGKGRSTQHGFAKKQSTWRLVFISTGELSLSQVMEEIGSRAKAGQEVRLIEIPADTGIAGLFEDLHGFKGGADFATSLKDACTQFYGTASRTFLKLLTEDIEGSSNMIKTLVKDFRQRYLPKAASPQVIRVFGHFALMAAAGELATKFGITGWAEEEALNGVMKCFQSWLDNRGGLGMQEEKEAISQVRSFFELHGESRFAPWERNPEDRTRTINRMGYRRETDEGPEFYVFTDSFRKEICKGLDYRNIEKICIKRVFLIPDRKGSPTRGERLPEMKKNKRCYRFSPDVLIGATEGNLNSDIEVL